MFQNMLMTTFTPLRATNEINQWDNQPFLSHWPDQEKHKNKGGEVTKMIKKKPKRSRTYFTSEQLASLEESFCKSEYIDKVRRIELGKLINIPDKQIKVWFQNRRMKKKRQTVDSSSDGDSSISPLSVLSTYDEPSLIGHSHPAEQKSNIYQSQLPTPANGENIPNIVTFENEPYDVLETSGPSVSTVMDKSYDIINYQYYHPDMSYNNENLSCLTSQNFGGLKDVYNNSFYENEPASYLYYTNTEGSNWFGFNLGYSSNNVCQ